jgi:alpha-1,2-mannosyltransferase
VPLYAVAVWALFLRPVRRSDLSVYLAAAQDLVHGLSPYPELGSAFVWSGSAFVYPIVAAVPFLPLALLPATAADLVYFGLAVLALLLAVWWSPSRYSLAAYVGVLAAATTVRGLQVGTLNAFLLLGCVAAWHFRARAGRTAVALALVVVPKLFLLPLVAWLVVARRWRAVAATAALIGLLLLGGFALGPLDARDYVRMLGELSAHETHQGFALNRLVLGLGPAPGVAQACVLGVAAALGAVALAVWRRTGDEAVVFAGCVIAALLASPIVWSHYLVLALAPLLVARASGHAFAAFAVATWALVPPVGAGPLAAVSDALPTTAKVAGTQVLLLGVFAVVCVAALRVPPAQPSRTGAPVATEARNSGSSVTTKYDRSG